MLTQSWGLHLVSEIKVGPDTSFETAALLNTAQVAGPEAPPGLCVGEQLSLCSRTSVRDILHSHNLVWDAQSSRAFLRSPQKELCIPRTLTLVSWLCCPSLFGVFPSQREGMPCRLWDRALHQALSLPRLDVNAKIK